MTRKVGYLKCAALVVALAFAGGAAHAQLDLTTEGASGFVNGAFLIQIDPQSTGTGVIDSFVRIQASGSNTTQEGYNTTQNGVFDTGATDQFNHAIQVGDVPIIEISGVQYRQFLLDINESNTAAGDSFVSMDNILLFLGGETNSSSLDLSDGGPLGDLVWSLDGAGDTWVAMDYALNPGSGAGDMWLFVPNALFAGYADTDEVILYSHFGDEDVISGHATLPDGDYGVSDGFEEWAVVEGGTPIPEPTTLSLIGLGLAGLLVRRATKKA